jgi:hypothetical protein
MAVKELLFNLYHSVPKHENKRYRHIWKVHYIAFVQKFLNVIRLAW